MQMKLLYFDCFSGISGDMTIGALVDVGADPQVLENELKKLKIEEPYELSFKKVDKNGITSTKFDVLFGESAHDHMKDPHDHHHDHDDHHHSHDHHDHHHRSYKDIREMIEGSTLSSAVKELSLKIFEKIGKAEGLIHGVPLEKVHFHEVGALDSIIDIVGTAILIDHLNIDQIKSSPIPVGSGSVHIAHGIYPVPAPATLEILRGVPLKEQSIASELTTPTGAAIAAVLAGEFCTLPAMTVESIGYGAGTKSFPDHPNVLRVVIGEVP